MALIWLSVVATLGGFFLPWARLDLHRGLTTKRLEAMNDLTRNLGRVTVKIRRGTQTISGELPRLSDIPREVSGAQIPMLAHQPNAQVAVALLALFTPQQQNIERKSYAVYLLPVVALLCGVVVTYWGSRAIVCVSAALLSGLVAGVGFWKLLTVNTQTLFVAITIGPGLWLSLWAYVVLAVAAGVRPLTRAMSRATFVDAP